jgi:hypothetical protein
LVLKRIGTFILHEYNFFELAFIKYEQNLNYLMLLIKPKTDNEKMLNGSSSTFISEPSAKFNLVPPSFD